MSLPYPAFIRREWYRSSLALLLAGAISPAVAMATTPASRMSPIEIANPTFTATGSGLPGWTFESVSLDYGAEMGSVTPRVGPAGDSTATWVSGQDGARIDGEGGHARGDLVSDPLVVDAFRWMEVTVEYTILSGSPLVLASLRPAADRSRVALAFLPAQLQGEPQHETVRIHSGRGPGGYSLALSVVGVGSVHFSKVEMRDIGPYAAPQRPVLVLDLMHPEPVEQGPYGWDSIHKLVDVFGFSEVVFVHPFEVTPDLLSWISPALVVLSPTSQAMLEVDPSELDIDSYLAGVREAVEYGSPVVGICAGHHILTMAHGGRVGAVMEKRGEEVVRVEEWGPTELEILVEDPAFAGLPRYPFFRAVEAHSAVVHSSFTLPVNLARSERCALQVFRYPEKPWYTFQGHIEADWEYACPEGYLVWSNLLRGWGLMPPHPEDSTRASPGSQ